jgi:quercetin dioxygenase-like cupin family protein
MKKFISTSAVILFTLLCSAQPDTTANERQHIITPADINWRSGPPTLPPGAKFAVIEGDLKKEGAIIMRLLLPAGYEIPAHYHPGAERAIVLSGTYNMGTGDKFKKENCKKMPAGSMGVMPAGGIAHYGYASEETIIQVHIEGPLQITYINPGDDPRLKENKK